MGYWRFQFVSHLASSTLAGLAAGLMYLATDLYILTLIFNNAQWLGSLGGAGEIILHVANYLGAYLPLFEAWLVTTALGFFIFAAPQFMLAGMSAIGLDLHIKHRLQILDD